MFLKTFNSYFEDLAYLKFNDKVCHIMFIEGFYLCLFITSLVFVTANERKLCIEFDHGGKRCSF